MHNNCLLPTLSRRIAVQICEGFKICFFSLVRELEENVLQISNF